MISFFVGLLFGFLSYAVIRSAFPVVREWFYLRSRGAGFRGVSRSRRWF